MKLVKILVCLVIILGFSTIVYAEVPKMINYQGKITRPSGALVDTTTTMVFSIYADSTGGTALWTETQTPVDVQYGVFSVLLGSLNPIPDSVFDGDVRYLSVKVGDDSEMTPRKTIVSVGYAFKTEYSDTAEYARTAPAMPDADWEIKGDTLYHLNGNVGIGTATPSERLVIGDDLGVPATEKNMIVVNDASGTGNAAVSVGESATKRVSLKWDALNEFGGIGTTYGDLRLQYSISSNLLLVNGGGKVGIGTTTSPDGLLEVRKEIGGSTTLFKVSGYEGDINSMYVRSNGDILTVNHHGYNDSQKALYVNHDGSGYGAYILGKTYIDGNVGIGTTSPTSKLHVVGDIMATGTIYGNFDGTIDNADKVDGYHYSANWPTTLGNIQSACLNDFHNIGGTDDDVPDNDAEVPDNISVNNSRLYAPSGSGNVGIGTTSPRSKLDINGVANCQNYFRVYGDLVNYHELRHNGTTGALEIDPIATNSLVIPDGNVGIGTTPSYKLDVSGTIGTSGGVLTLMSGLGGITLDAQNNTITADRINPSLNGVYYLGGAGDRWGNIYTLDLDVSGSIVNFTGIQSTSGTITPVGVDGSGRLLKSSSSRRYKQNIEKLTINSDKVYQLEPVKYNWRTSGEVDIGLIAEDVAQAIPDLVIFDKDGNPDAVKYDRVAIYLLEIVKSQQERISALEKKIAELQK